MRSTKPRVLYVDENATSSFMFTTQLKLQGYDPVTVNFTSDALQFAQCEEFDVYLLSRRFPVGPGVYLCQQLHDISPKTPMVFLSDEVDATVRSGSEEYIAKARDTREMLNAVRLALAGRNDGAMIVNV